MSVMNALQRKTKITTSQDIQPPPPPTDANDIGVHEKSEHAVISAFDLFSIGGAFNIFVMRRNPF